MPPTPRICNTGNPGYQPANLPANTSCSNPTNAVTGGYWRPWTNSFPPASQFDSNGDGGYSQPWLTDITFDNGSMIIGLRDRFGDQSGYKAGSTNPADTK